MSTSHATQPDIPPLDNPHAKQITEHLRLGYRPERIARKLRVSMFYVLSAQRALEEALPPDEDEAARQLSLLALRHVREEALEAWEVSKEGEKTVTTSGPEEGKRKITEKIRHHAGDPRYLDRVTRVVEVEARLRALDKRPAAKGSAASNAEQAGPGGLTHAQKAHVRYELAIRAAYEEILTGDWKLHHRRLELVQKNIGRLIEEGVPIDEKTQVESLLDQLNRHLAMFPADAAPLAENAPAEDLPVSKSVVVKSEISDLRFPISENTPADTVAEVNLLDDDEEDQDEDEYLIERYGPDAPELMKPNPLAPTPAPRTLPGPAPATGGPPRREQIRDTS